MDNVTKMQNKAIRPEHNKMCRCGECLHKAALQKAEQRAQRNKQAKDRSTNLDDSFPRYGQATFG